MHRVAYWLTVSRSLLVSSILTGCPICLAFSKLSECLLLLFLSRFALFVLWYTHDDINNNNNTGGLSRLRYDRVYFFLPSVLGYTRKDTIDKCLC